MGDYMNNSGLNNSGLDGLNASGADGNAGGGYPIPPTAQMNHERRGRKKRKHLQKKLENAYGDRASELKTPEYLNVLSKMCDGLIGDQRKLKNQLDKITNSGNFPADGNNDAFDG